MSEPRLNFSVDGMVARVVFEHPPQNPLGMVIVDQLREALAEVRANPDVRVLIMTGAGDVFSAGANIKEFAQAINRYTLDGFLLDRQGLADEIADLGKPVVAVINGNCFGGGMELALACHIRIAGHSARLGLPEVDIGAIPAWGGTQRLARVIGPARALDVMLLARHLTAAEALEWGLVTEVVPDDQLQDRGREIASRLCEKPPMALAAIIAAVNRGIETDLAAGLAIERQQAMQVVSSEDSIEGYTAFIEKRKPVFKGR